MSVSSSAQSKERVIQRLYQQPIADRLLPDDAVVKVIQNLDYASRVTEPNREEILAYLIDTSEHVAVIDVQQVRSLLVENGDWIRTRLTGVIHEVLRSTGDRRLSPGQTIDMEISGGEMTIGRVLVRTDDAMSVSANRRYLLFLEFVSAWNTFTTRAPLMIEGERLVSPQLDDRGFSLLHGVTMGEVRKKASDPSRQR